MKTKTSKEEQKNIDEIAWGKNIKLKEKEISKKKGEFGKNLKENLSKLKEGADKLSEGLIGKEGIEFNDIDLFGKEPEIDLGLNKDMGF